MSRPGVTRRTRLNLKSQARAKTLAYNNVACRQRSPNRDSIARSSVEHVFARASGTKAGHIQHDRSLLQGCGSIRHV